MTSLTTERLGQLTISCSVRFFHRALPPLEAQQSRPFRPEDEPASVQTKPLQAENILTPIAENERIGVGASDPAKRAIALTWLFHLVGDLHQPLHTVQLLTREYSQGDRGGNQICVRVAPDRAPLDLHRLWDGLL